MRALLAALALLAASAHGQGTLQPTGFVELQTQVSVDVEVDKPKQGAVRSAMRHAFKGYKDGCWGKDELEPLSNACSSWLQMGLTIVDSLDTLHVMGLTDELDEATNWALSDKLSFNQVSVSVFETNIRILAGLLSAYELTNKGGFLDKAHELGKRMSPAFKSASGIPPRMISLLNHDDSIFLELAVPRLAREPPIPRVPKDHPLSPGFRGTSDSSPNPLFLATSAKLGVGMSMSIGVLGTFQLEFTTLSRHTGDDSYRAEAQKLIDDIDDGKSDTLYGGEYVESYSPSFLGGGSAEHKNARRFGQGVTFGGEGDSFYEYLLKSWILTGKTNEQAKRMYKSSIHGMINELLTESKDGHWYVAEKTAGGERREVMEHLTCFLPGTMALGVSHRVVEGSVADQHLDVAKKLMKTCVEMYTMNPSKLGPEYVVFTEKGMEVDPTHSSYQLRPETMESLMYLYRTTGEQKYRDWGWNMFSAIETHCKTDRGYVGLHDVSQPAPRQLDDQPSWFLAETLKYAYLLFSDEQTMPLDKVVFNTEAHPFQIWTPKASPQELLATASASYQPKTQLQDDLLALQRLLSKAPVKHHA